MTNHNSPGRTMTWLNWVSASIQRAPFWVKDIMMNHTYKCEFQNMAEGETFWTFPNQKMVLNRNVILVGTVFYGQSGDGDQPEKCLSNGVGGTYHIRATAHQSSLYEMVSHFLPFERNTKMVKANCLKKGDLLKIFDSHALLLSIETVKGDAPFGTNRTSTKSFRASGAEDGKREHNLKMLLFYPRFNFTQTCFTNAYEKWGVP